MALVGKLNARSLEATPAARQVCGVPRFELVLWRGQAAEQELFSPGVEAAAEYVFASYVRSGMTIGVVRAARISQWRVPMLPVATKHPTPSASAMIFDCGSRG